MLALFSCGNLRRMKSQVRGAEYCTIDSVQGANPARRPRKPASGVQQGWRGVSVSRWGKNYKRWLMRSLWGWLRNPCPVAQLVQGPSGTGRVVAELPFKRRPLFLCRPCIIGPFNSAPQAPRCLCQHHKHGIRHPLLLVFLLNAPSPSALPITAK